jgi:hypothetical protein
LAVAAHPRATAANAREAEAGKTGMKLAKAQSKGIS